MMQHRPDEIRTPSYEPPNLQRKHSILSREDVEAGKKNRWAELEIKGQIKNIGTVWHFTHLRILHLNNNMLDRLPPDIAKLTNLQYLDLSANRLSSLPIEIGNMIELRELHVNNNHLHQLPREIGRLFKLQMLGLKGNPLIAEVQSIYDNCGTYKLLQYLLDSLGFDAAHPPERNWIPLGHPERYVPTARFTIMCYNVLCDKYCTRQQYGYTPSWALHWDYRKKGILEEIKHYHADIISLQEVETDQYHAFFLPELASIGYDGIFSPKSRARVMNEKDRGGVDGCAIFWKTSKFRLVKQHLIEFNKLAVANAEGSENVLNRVMTKDNIGLCALLQTKRDVWVQGQCHLPEGPAHQLILISTVHLLWDPEFSDVKLIQSIMLMSELTDIIRNAHQCQKTIWETCKADVSQIPVILCGDLNSLPDSGVVEFLSTGKVAVKHPDFKDINYEKVLETFSHTADYDYLTHGLNLTQAYTTDHMKYTNYTYDFKGFIDYVFASEKHLKPLGVLGPLDENWFTENNIVGCPHPYVPSDHFSLLVEFEMPSLTTFSQKASQNIVVRW